MGTERWGQALLGLIEMIRRRIPSDIVVAYDASTFKKLVRLDRTGITPFGNLNPLITRIMEEDGWFGDVPDGEPTEEFLQECLDDDYYEIRNLARALREGSFPRAANGNSL